MVKELRVVSRTSVKNIEIKLYLFLILQGSSKVNYVLKEADKYAFII